MIAAQQRHPADELRALWALAFPRRYASFISPMLANVYLHYALDLWFKKW